MSDTKLVQHNENFCRQYTIHTLRKGDFDHFWCTVFLANDFPKRVIAAIRAFNLEISRVRDRASQDHLAKIRLQFWYDAIEKIYTQPEAIIESGEPVLQEIKSCNEIVGGKMSKRWFLRMIEARQSHFGLADFPFNTLNEYESYCESTHCSANYLINEALVHYHRDLAPEKVLLKLDHMGNHLGKAQGLANLVRGITFNAKNNRCYIPSEMLIKHNVTHQDFLRQNNLEKIRDVCFDLSSKSHQHLSKAKDLTRDASLRPYYATFLPIFVVQRFLTKLQKNNFNIFRPTWGQADLFLPLNLLFRTKFSRFFRL
ncbi:NADH dehydrogenase (ubiquinone) complex I, assembly factor 6 homolog sicily isoform X2 [Brevipalpus obovatus]|uniref:NADH dehydrogenase (ubiquinone) complex I, assembly factor 6 homolog sicily isoform X2 n=1 Tax=Brevipalpus obovatus TaxID=246614 RepID=UPI003D9DB600